MSHLIALPLLDRIRIASPCAARWEDMEGDARARHCGQCRLNVYNLSEMTREEAERVMTTTGAEGVCVRMYRRADGTVLTRDCPVGRALLRQKLAARTGRVAAALLVLLTGRALLGAGGRAPAQPRLRDTEPFGAICRWLLPPLPAAPPPPSAAGILMGSISGAQLRAVLGQVPPSGSTVYCGHAGEIDGDSVLGAEK
jgi:hypothetical protein